MKTTLTVLLIINLHGPTSCTFKEHHYIELEKNWTNAQQYCRTRYHEMSTFINETEEQQFLQDAVSQNSDAWIGLYRSGVWTWTTGEVATQISWDSGEPSVYNYAMLNKASKKLHDALGVATLPFFCMMVSEIVMVQQTESWEGAVDYCRDHYSDLAFLNSNRRMDYAVNKISGAQTQYVWIGLRFLAGDWFWTRGGNLQYQVWSSPGQLQCPEQNQRCAALDKNTKTWTPRDCEEKLNFLCV